MLKWFLKRINNKKGFTLVELVVVIAILGILSAIAVPRLSKSRQTAVVTAHNSNIRTLESAANMYIADKGIPSENKDFSGNDSSSNEMVNFVQEWPKVPEGINAGDGAPAAGADYKVTISKDGKITIAPGKAEVNDSGGIVVAPSTDEVPGSD